MSNNASTGDRQQGFSDLTPSLGVDQLRPIEFRDVKHVGDLIQVRIDLGKVQDHLVLRKRRGDAIQQSNLVIGKERENRIPIDRLIVENHLRWQHIHRIWFLLSLGRPRTAILRQRLRSGESSRWQTRLTDFARLLAAGVS